MILNIPITFELDFTPLTLRAQCDEAKDDLEFLFKTYNVRDQNLDLADERTSRSLTDVLAAIARKDSAIVKAQGDAGNMALSAQERQDASDDVELLQAERKQLLRRTRTTTGAPVFVANVSAAQVETQATVLAAILAALAAHRATLTA